MTHPDKWLNVRPAAPPVTSAEAKPAEPVKAGPDPDHGVTRADLDALAQRHVERVQDEQMRGELAVAHLLGQAPSLVAAMQKLKDEGRA
ncbi:hypothetical protein [Gemmobacter sp.]|uniref:hypothetical protein n=1 Tax=Gemmobacter sp. TaxID=1898957 RepID=UPI002AFFC72C|nr:hypothetical protein [Gemmobacter sp.]